MRFHLTTDDYQTKPQTQGQRMKGFAKGSIVGKRAGAKAAVSRKYNAKISTAIENGDKASAAGFKAAKTRALRKVDLEIV